MAQDAAGDPTGVLQALTPIGVGPPPVSAVRVSAAERRHRTRRARRLAAAQPEARDPLDAPQDSARGQNPHAEVSLTARRYRRALSSLPVRTLSLSDQLAMAASLTTEFFALSLHHAVCSRCGNTYPNLLPECRTPECRGRVVLLAAASRKNLATAWAIVQDKLMLLQGRPTEILDVRSVERARPALLDIARKVAEIRAQRSDPKPA